MNKTNKWFLNTILILAGIFLLTEIVLHFDIKEIIAQYASFSLKLIGIYLLISFSISLILTLRWQYILKSYGYKISLGSLFSYRMAGYFVGYLTPSAHIGGEPIRAYYLKKHKVPFSKGLSSVLVDRALQFTGDAAFAFVGFFILIINYAVSLNQIVAMVLMICTVLFFTTLFYYNALNGKGSFSMILEKTKLTKFRPFRKLRSFFIKIEKNVSFFFKNKKKELFISISFTVALWILMFFEYKIALRLIGVEATTQMIFLVISFVGLSYVIPVPAALGTLEAGQLSVFSLLSIDKAKAIAFSFLIRGRDLMWVCIGGIFIYVKRHHFLEHIEKIKLKNKFKKNRK